MPEDNIQQPTQTAATPSPTTPNRQDQAAGTQGPQESVIKSEKPQAGGMFSNLTDLSFKRDLKQGWITLPTFDKTHIRAVNVN